MSERMIKTGGLAGLLAAVLLVVSTALAQVVGNPDVYASPGNYLVQALNTAAYVAAIVAIMGFHALLSRTGRFRRLGLVGAWLAGIGYAAMALLTVANLIAGGRILVPVRIGAAGLLLLGSVILGVIVFATRLLPWWCGVLLIVAFPLGDVTNELLFAGSESILLALLWGSVGAGLLTRATRPAERSSAEPARVR
jgi:hypothetical protein